MCNCQSQQKSTTNAHYCTASVEKGKNYIFVSLSKKMTDQSQDKQQEWVGNLEIDCAPGSARPDAILKLILSSIDTKLSYEDFYLKSCCFGEWTFQYKQEKQALYDAARPKIGEMLKKLNSEGAIRYAEW